MVATRQIVDETTFRYKTEGAEKAVADANKVADAQQEVAKTGEEVASSTERSERRVISARAALERFAAANDAAFRAQQQVEKAQALVNRALEQGLGGTVAYQRATAALAEKQAHLARVTAQAAAANDNAAAKARAGWSALSAQGAAQEKATLATERAAAQWRNLSAQGAAQGRALENLRASNDNVATGFAAQGTQIGALLPGYSKLIALAGALGAVFTAGQFIQTVTSFQAIDASLKAATGSTEAAQSALAFIRAESDRLGLSLGSTAKDFASFAASTRGTELEGERARKVFSSIAEAGTVLGLSADDMSGALLALSQMASKGTVSSEELRGQLGERLPGAFNIAAKAMGVTTAELGKMLESGQVLASDFLPKFADEMHKAFGPEAANASKNLQANLNRLQTSITDLFLAAGKGGLTEALNDATRQATAFLKSSQDAAASAGGALANGIRAAGSAFEFLRRNSDLAGAGLAALIALRFGPSVLEIAASIGRAIAAMGVYDVATRQLVVSQSAAIASSRALSIAMGAFGGPIGLALTAAAAGVAYLALRQDEGVKAAEAQAAGLKTLDAALQQNKNSLIGASDETKKLAAEQLAAARAAVEAARARLSQAQAQAADASPEVGVPGFEAYSAGADRATESTFRVAAAQADLDDKSQRLDATVRRVAGTATDADRVLLGLPPSIASVTASLDAAIPSMQKYADAMSKLIAMVPQLQQAVDAQNKVGAAQAALNNAIASAGEAHLKGEISFKEMVKRGEEARQTHKAATEEITGYSAALKKVATDERAAAVAGMDERQAAIAKLQDTHKAYIATLYEGSNAQMDAGKRADIVARQEAVLAQQVANTNKTFDERDAKKAGAAATKEAGKAAREAAQEFDGFEKQADAAFKKLFPEEALRKKGQELQALLDKYEERLAKIDPRLVDSMKTTIKFNLDGKEVEGVKHKTDELATEMSQTFRGVFDEMFSAGNKGFDGLLNSFTRSMSRIGTRLMESTFLTPMFGGGKEGGSSGGGLNLFGGLDFDKLGKAISEGSFEGVYTSLSDWVKPASGGAEGAGAAASGGFASSKLGGGLMAAGVGASIGYQSQSPLMGIAGGALAGSAYGPWGAVIGAGAGLIGGLLGKDQAKKAAAKRLKEQLEAYREAYKQAEPEIKKLEATFRGESIGAVGGQIDAAFQQAVQANKTASQAGDQKRADSIMQDFVKYAWRLRDVFMNAFEGTLAEVAAGFGTSGPFAQANAAVATLGESLKAFVKDAESLPQPEVNSARARAAAQQAALASLDPPKALSDTQTRLAAIQGTAAGLSRVLQDLGMSADEAATAIRDRTAKAMDALRAQFSADLGAKINDAAGKSYLNDIADLVKERDGLLADARAIGADTAQVGRYFTLAAQKIVDGSELTGDAFTALVKRFPELRGAVVEFGQAVDSTAAKAEAAARATGYQDRSFAAGNDTSTLAGALAAQDRKAAQDRAAEAKAGGRAMADLEKALADERTAIIRDFKARAEEAEKAAAEATARRVLSAEDRLFAARNDSATLTGRLAEIDRQHAQERAEEVRAGGQALAKLEEAQAAERLKIVREAGAAEVAARKAAAAEAQTFLDGASKNIRTYLDGLKAGSETNLSPGARLKEAQAQFDRQLKLAKGGDRDALGSLTTYADRLLDAGKGQFASGKGYQDILGSVTKQLGALPKQVSAEQFIVDAIKEQTTALKTAVGTGSASETAKALGPSFSKLDTNTNGLLSQKEFLAALGPKATVAEQQAALAVFREIDLNGDGQLSKLELARAQLKGAIEANRPALIQKALAADFSKLDTSANGLLSPEEFLAGLDPLATAAEQAAAMEWFKSIDANGDGQLSELELLRGQMVTALTVGGPQAMATAIKTNFPKLDINKDGLLSSKEFLNGLGPLASKKEQQDALAVFKEIDLNGDGQLSKLELARSQIKGAIEANSPGLIQKALSLDFAKLDKLDTNTKGSLTIAEFKTGLGPLATKAEQDAAELLFKAIDENGDGLLTKTELMRGQLLTALKTDSPQAMATAIKTNFPKVDINKDGLLSKTEFLSGLGPLASKEEQAKALKVFDSIDLDGDGQISKLEALRTALGSNLTGINAVSKAVSDNFATLDKNGSGGLSLKEFKAALGPLATKADQKAAEAYFKAIDADGDGIISKVELARVDLLAGLKLNEPGKMASAIAASFKTIDLNADAKIDWNEYVKAVGPATKAEQAAAKKVFDQIDLDGDGFITKMEAVRVDLLAQLKLNDPAKMAVALSSSFAEIDLNKDKAINLDEYLKSLGKLTATQRTDAQKLFAAMDRDKSGTLTPFELAAWAIVDAVKANSPTAFATALDKNFTALNTTVDGVLDKDELATAIKGLATAADQEKARGWIEKLDTNNNKQLDKQELLRLRLVDVQTNTGNTKTAVDAGKSATDSATAAVKDGTVTAKEVKKVLDGINTLSGLQKTAMEAIQGYQKTSNDNLATAKASLSEIEKLSTTQKSQLELLNKQFTLESPVGVPNTNQVLNNGMLSALNKIVYNTGQTVNGLIKLMSTGKPDGMLYTFAEGGYTGPGGKYDAAGIVHRGEVVWSQVDVARAGGVAAVEAMRLGANDNRFAPMPMPVPVTGGGMDVSALLSEQRATREELRSLRADNKALLEMLARNVKAGADKVAGKVEETTDEVAGSREDARRDAAPMRAGRGASVKAA